MIDCDLIHVKKSGIKSRSRHSIYTDKEIYITVIDALAIRSIHLSQCRFEPRGTTFLINNHKLFNKL